ncbi:hypothetical protein DXT95_02705 [Agrobacterium tumefaciens]|nr:hypothetical protein [Agrobacterium tumefaciens]
MSVCAVHPPLSCRTSPPQGGRSNRGDLSIIFMLRLWRGASHLPISPLVGEMSGRTEGVL